MGVGPDSYRPSVAAGEEVNTPIFQYKPENVCYTSSSTAPSKLPR